jgi:hypothetical protein
MPYDAMMIAAHNYATARREAYSEGGQRGRSPDPEVRTATDDKLKQLWSVYVSACEVYGVAP